MARPFYIICSQLSVDDKLTGCVSFFNVIERLSYSRTPIPGLPPLQMHIVSAWMREPDDGDTEFEWSARLSFVTSNAEMQLGSGKFKFDTPVKRITAKLMGTPPQIAGATEMIAWVAIRPIGTDHWLSHEYPIGVEEVIQKPPEPSLS